MRAYSAMLFIVCFALATWLIGISQIYPVGGQLWVSPVDVMTQFGFSIFAGIGIAGTIIGVGLALLRPQAVSALITIWLLGTLVVLGLWFVPVTGNGGIFVMLSLILPAELWYITSLIQALFTVVFFIFMVEVTGQRQIT